MAAKIAPVKASGLKHLISGHYAAKVAGKAVVVKLPHNLERPAEGSEIDVYPDWLVDGPPEFSQVQKDYAEFVKTGGRKDVGGENANAPGDK